jgi:hypothetical protein
MDYSMPRRWPRFRSTSPAVVEVLDTPDSGGKFVAGSTRDIGAGGVYVVSEEGMMLGLRVHISVNLERLGRVVRTLGSVVRCESSGFAVEFDEVLTEEPMHLQASPC